MRVADHSPPLTIALTGALLTLAAACAGPTRTGSGRQHGAVLDQNRCVGILRQRQLENAMATTYGGAIARATPGSQDPCHDMTMMRVRPPVRGYLAHKFGEMDAKGRPLNGAVFRAIPRSQVVAPIDSTIIHIGTHPDYGPLLILEAGGGYHFVLAGMTKIYGVEGQKLLEGEPVGVMGASGDDVQVPDVRPGTGTGNAANGNAGPELYFQIRHNSKPINLLPWLATTTLERTSP